MTVRLSKDMPSHDVSTFVRTLTTELRKDPDAGAKLAKELIREFARATGVAPLVPHDEEREKQLSAAVGKKIHELRKSIGMSGAELARRALCSQAYISRLENAAGDPSLIILRRIAKVLGVRVSELLKVYDEA
jgi:ribosome-binding protein aMBF1 (putative translation factor)